MGYKVVTEKHCDYCDKKIKECDWVGPSLAKVLECDGYYYTLHFCFDQCFINWENEHLL